LPPEVQARRDLEDALRNIGSIANVLDDLGDASEGTLIYLADRLREHQEEAYDAFSRIFKLDEYRQQEAAQ
jgi:hypothetical protein